MNQGISPVKTKTLRLVKILASLVVALLLLHTILLVASGIALRNARAELRAAGRPMTKEEIIPKEVPPSENAAPLYQSAFALLDSESIDGKKLSIFLADAAKEYATQPDSDEKRLAFENELSNKTFTQALALVEQATTRTQCNFNLEYDLGPSLHDHHTTDMFSIGRILNAKALLHAHRGEPQQAYDTLETALHMANALRNEPLLISAIVHNAQFRVALETLPVLCTIAPPDDNTAAHLIALLDGVDPVAPLVRAWDGERLLLGEWIYNCFADGNIHDFLELFDLDNGPVWLARFAKRVLGYRPSLQLDHAFYLRNYARFANNASLPFWKISPPPPRNPDDVFPWYATISRFVMINFNSSFLSTVHVQAQLRVSRTGLALLRHKLAHGAYPASLDQIDPQFLSEIPLDPFTGQPLVYRPEGDGFVLYSLGDNLADDNGAPESPDNHWAFDIAWRMPR